MGLLRREAGAHITKAEPTKEARVWAVHHAVKSVWQEVTGYTVAQREMEPTWILL